MANDFAFQVTCDHTPSCKSGGPNPEDAIMDVRNANKAAWLAVVQAGQGGHFTCDVCGCEYELEVSGENISQIDVSKPRIDSLGATQSGSTAGGTTIQVNGHRLNYGTVVVKINGNACTNIQNQSDASLECDTPAGTMLLNQVGNCWRKLDISNVSGTFQVDETITGGTTGTTAVVKIVESTYLILTDVIGTPEFQADETITGGTSGATATADGAVDNVSPGETATGLTSGATSTLADPIVPLHPRIHSISGSYSAGETCESSVAKTRIVLDGTSPTVGDVDVTVENGNGLRTSGGTLAGGFEYT